MMKNIKAALFDLDGVVFDTETQYSVFWGMIGKEYHPEMPDFAQRIKGQTLTQIYDGYFDHVREEQAAITARLDDFERNMQYAYIPGIQAFLADLKNHGVKCAVVTSSNKAKMNNVYAQHPEFAAYFDRILTSEDFAESKPHPDCYLKGAAAFGVTPQECVGFEDSFNGLKAVRAADEFTVGLSTTNPADAIAPLADTVIPDFTGFTYARLVELVSA